MSDTPADPSLGETIADALFAMVDTKRGLDGKPLPRADLRPLFVAEVHRCVREHVTGANGKPPAMPRACDLPGCGDPSTIPPLSAWVTAYSAAIGYPLNGDAWCSVYEQKGWMVGRTKMKNWQSAVRNWKTNDYASPAMKRIGSASTGTGSDGAAGAGNGARDYSKI